MKKILILLSVIAVMISVNAVMAEDAVEQTKTEQIMETVSAKTHVAAEKTADSVKAAADTEKFWSQCDDFKCQLWTYGYPL